MINKKGFHVIKFRTILFLMFFFIYSVIHGEEKKQRIIVIAPHPDDAEASCGGLIANYTGSGNEVIILTMTGGEYGIWGKSPDEACEIRTNEAKNAAKVLGSSIEFFGAIDGALNVDTLTFKKLKSILQIFQPDVVLAPWPMDVHPDHQASGLLAWRLFLDTMFHFKLFFYETTNSPHTKTFQFIPTHYIDITKVIDKKKEALLQQKSQNPSDWWKMYEFLAIVRGYEADVSFAEAYIQAHSSSGFGGRCDEITSLILH